MSQGSLDEGVQPSVTGWIVHGSVGEEVESESRGQWVEKSRSQRWRSPMVSFVSKSKFTSA